ncbi:MAG: YkyA family protein [Bacilli bacterium]
MKKRFPIITIVVLACVAVFLFFQANEARKLSQAVDVWVKVEQTQVEQIEALESKSVVLKQHLSTAVGLGSADKALTDLKAAEHHVKEKQEIVQALADSVKDAEVKLRSVRSKTFNKEARMKAWKAYYNIVGDRQTHIANYVRAYETIVKQELRVVDGLKNDALNILALKQAVVDLNAQYDDLAKHLSLFNAQTPKLNEAKNELLK